MKFRKIRKQRKLMILMKHINYFQLQISQHLSKHDMTINHWDFGINNMASGDVIRLMGGVGVVGKDGSFICTHSYLSRGGLRDWLCSCQSWMQPAGGRAHFSHHVALSIISIVWACCTSRLFWFSKGQKHLQNCMEADLKKPYSIDSSLDSVAEYCNHVGREKDINSIGEIKIKNMNMSEIIVQYLSEGLFAIFLHFQRHLRCI